MPEVNHDIEEEQALQIAMFITQRRIYDVLMGIYYHLDKHKADQLAELHEQGIFITPPPAYRPGEDDDGIE